MNKHRAEPPALPAEDDDQEAPPRDQAAALPMSAWVFGAAFAVAGFWHMAYDATHKEYAAAQLTIFLGSAALLILGYPIGKLVGRK